MIQLAIIIHASHNAIPRFGPFLRTDLPDGSKPYVFDGRLFGEDQLDAFNAAMARVAADPRFNQVPYKPVRVLAFKMAAEIKDKPARPPKAIRAAPTSPPRRKLAAKPRRTPTPAAATVTV